MQTTTLSIDDRGVARLTLARPSALNAFDETMIDELTGNFQRLGADSAVRCIVLAAQGKVFCAGADIAWMQRQSCNTHEDNLRDARQFAEMMRSIHECPKPVIACVQGSAFGGGVGLMAAVDIVIASQHASFAVTEAKFGILPAVIGPYLVNAVGRRHALRLAMQAAKFSADDARDMGLVHESVPAETLEDSVNKSITGVLNNGPTALGEIKILFGRLGTPISPDIRELTAQTIARVRATDEAREGFSAFLEKRSARWVTT